MRPIETQPLGATLIALDSDVQPTEYPLTTDLCTIGRAPDCHVVVPRTFVSRLHVWIERQGAYFVLNDNNSANGTFVNGQPVQRGYQLKHEDEIGLADTSPLLRFLDHDPTAFARRRLRYLPREQQFVYNGEILNLSRNLYRLLKHLYDHLGEVCSHESCIRAIWHEDAKYDSGRLPLLHTEISELRDKFERIEPGVDVIITRRGMGYSLNPKL